MCPYETLEDQLALDTVHEFEKIAGLLGTIHGE